MTRSTLLVAALFTTLAATSALAAPNDGRFKKSAEGMRAQLPTVCQTLKESFDTQEYFADKYAGTKAAKPFSDAADALWEAGAKAGCSWAS